MFTQIRPRLKYLYNITMPKKYEMRVIHTYKEAYEIGEKYIQNLVKG